MYFAIFAISVSIVQILLGMAIGLRLARRSREEGAVPRRLMQEPKRVEQTAIAVKSDAANHLEAAPVAALLDVKHAFHGDGAMQHPSEESLQLNASAVQRDEEIGENDKQLPGARETMVRQNGHGEQPTGAISPSHQTEPADDMPAGADRRVSTRRVFEYRQFVAPYHGGSLPGKASFREVECQDISPTGFSFLSSQLPDFDSLVVALGVPPHLIYVQAQIVNRFQVVEGYAPLYRIGCRFAGQVA